MNVKISVPVCFYDLEEAEKDITEICIRNGIDPINISIIPSNDVLRELEQMFLSEISTNETLSNICNVKCISAHIRDVFTNHNFKINLQLKKLKLYNFDTKQLFNEIYPYILKSVIGEYLRTQIGEITWLN